MESKPHFNLIVRTTTTTGIKKRENIDGRCVRVCCVYTFCTLSCLYETFVI